MHKVLRLPKTEYFTKYFVFCQNVKIFKFYNSKLETF